MQTLHKLNAEELRALGETRAQQFLDTWAHKSIAAIGHSAMVYKCAADIKHALENGQCYTTDGKPISGADHFNVCLIEIGAVLAAIGLNMCEDHARDKARAYADAIMQVLGDKITPDDIKNLHDLIFSNKTKN